MTALWSDTESSGYMELSRTITNSQKEKPEGGFVKSISIGSFLQLFEMEQKTCLLEFRGNGKRQIGFFYFVEGVLYEAVCGELKGKEAALEVIGWDKAEIRFHEAPKKKITKQIHGELMGLIMEAMRLKDEADADEADAEELEEPEGLETEEKKLLSEAILLAEGFHFRDAQIELTKVLRNNPHNFDAWLWYSRISTDLMTINRCLQNAKQLSPNDPGLILEIRKFELAKKDKLENADLRRCPFCWCILKTGFFQCPFCNAFLRIDGTFLACRKYADRPLLDKAINRYRRIAKRTKDNFNIHYYLGLAHVNLENWDDAIRNLSKAVDLSSQNPFFSEQLDYVLMYLASGNPFLALQKTDPEVAPTPSTVEKKTILVVEDSRTTRMVISTTLGKKGYRIVEAGDGLEALSKLNEERPDLILLDIILPKMDGYQVLGVIRKQSELKNIPVVMLTAKDKFMDKVKGKISGSSEYLTKPFDPQDLIKMASKYLD